MNEKIFSIIKSEMYLNNDKDMINFDIDEMESFCFDFLIVPLFDERTDVGHDLFDLMFFGTFAIITIIWKNIEGKKIPVTASLSTTDSDDLKNNTYSINLEVKKETFKFEEDSSLYTRGYFLTVSPIIVISQSEIESLNSKDIMRLAEENIILNIALPFRKNGVWLLG